MLSSRKKVHLGGYIDHQKGFAFKSSEYTSTGHPIIRVSNFTDRSIDISGLYFISADSIEKYEKFKVRAFDVVIATVGSWPTNPASVVGRTICIPPECEGTLLNQNAVILRAKNELRQKYLFYLLKTHAFQEYIVSKAQGSANQASITLEDIFGFEFQLPTPAMQDLVIYHLRTIDEKIDLNRSMNETLGAMALALFKEWFVDFGPVRAKMESRWQQGQSLPGLPAHLYDIFPSKFEDSELGLIPKGWYRKKLGEISTVVKGKSYKSSELSSSKTALVTLKSFNRCGGYRLDGLKGYTGLYKPDQEVFSGDLVIAFTDVTQAADVIGKPALVMPDDRYEHLVVSLDVGVIRPLKSNHKLWIYGLALTEKFQEHMRSHTTGTTVLHLSASAVPGFEFYCPHDFIIDEYINFATPLFSKIEKNVVENNYLVNLRELLLPKLISGQIRIKDAEKILGCL